MKKLSLLAILLYSSLSFSKSLGLNDLSLLLPLPDVHEIDLLLSPQHPNQLLPESAYRFLPVLTPLIDHDTCYQNNLKVIAIRFDPCFTEGVGPQKCQSQIRLVWQPLIIDRKTNRITTVDAAVHSFYQLTPEQWTLALDELKRISSTDPSLPLTIHPIIQKEGYNGPYWQSIQNLVLKYASQNNLSRATVMTVRMDRVWGFQGIDKKNSQWTQIEIPTLKSPNNPQAKVVNQAFFLEPESLFDVTEFKGGVTLIETANKTWFKLISDSKKYADRIQDSELQDLMGKAYRIENPELHNPGTIDCVSCHIAQTVRLWGENHFPQTPFTDLLQTDIYKNTKTNLKNMSVNPRNVNRARAFGYFDQDPIISQRIINETAAILTGLQ